MILNLDVIREILSMTERGVEVRVTTNYKLSDDDEYGCAHCDATVLDNMDEYIGDVILEPEYHTIESVDYYLKMNDSGYAWITDKMCAKCKKPYSIINGC